MWLTQREKESFCRSVTAGLEGEDGGKKKASPINETCLRFKISIGKKCIFSLETLACKLKYALYLLFLQILVFVR